MIETGEPLSFWHKFVNNVVLKYNTSYHATIGCEPSRVFHGSIPYPVLDLKLGNLSQQSHILTSEVAQDVLDHTEMIYQDVRKNDTQAHIKYRACYNKNSNASKLKQADYVCVLQPNADP